MDASDLRLLTTGRALLRLQTPGIAKGARSLLVAAPDYDAAPAGAMPLPQQFEPLADAKAEAQQLMPLLNGPQLRLGRQASGGRAAAQQTYTMGLQKLSGMYGPNPCPAVTAPQWVSRRPAGSSTACLASI